MTIREIYDVFMPLKKLQVKESSYATYRMAYENHILPYFGDMEYEEVRMSTVQTFIYEKHRDGISRHTLRDLALDIKMLLSFAQEEMDMPPVPGKRNLVYPADSSMEKPELEVYSEEEQRKLVSWCIASNPCFPNIAIVLTLVTGMRIGEACGLRFSDLDLEKRTLSISRIVERIYDYSDDRTKHTKIVIASPKTSSSRRTVPLPADVVRLLKRCLGVVRPDYYIASGTASPMEPRRLRNHFIAECEKAGVRRIKFHGLRHSFATRLLENRVDVKTCSVLLGHADIQTTMNTYVHPTEEMKAKAISVNDKLFKSLTI